MPAGFAHEDMPEAFPYPPVLPQYIAASDVNTIVGASAAQKHAVPQVLMPSMSKESHSDPMTSVQSSAVGPSAVPNKPEPEAPAQQIVDDETYDSCDRWYAQEEALRPIAEGRSVEYPWTPWYFRIVPVYGECTPTIPFQPWAFRGEEGNSEGH